MTARTVSRDTVSQLGAEREARRVLWRLVRYLEVAFQISADDDALVSAVGAGSERTNHEALFSWVLHELGQPDGALAAELLPELTRRLERTLRRWELERY